MADHQRIHPVDVESPPVPSAPVAPSELAKPEAPAEKTSLPLEATTEPVVLPAAAAQLYPAPPKKRRSRCCRCFCWTVLALVVLVVAVGATVGILYLVFDPKIPNYSVDRLQIANFTTDNSTVRATFNVTVTSRNPNKHIGIYYRGGSHLSAWYEDYDLCSGSFPVFYQGHRNTTSVHVLLSGQADLGSEMIKQLVQQEETGTVPLLFRGKVPVRVKLGKLKLFRITFKVKCHIVVNSLSSSSQISIKSRTCKFRLKL